MIAILQPLPSNANQGGTHGLPAVGVVIFVHEFHVMLSALSLVMTLLFDIGGEEQSRRR
jgi:hypothetical protein